MPNFLHLNIFSKKRSLIIHRTMDFLKKNHEKLSKENASESLFNRSSGNTCFSMGLHSSNYLWLFENLESGATERWELKLLSIFFYFALSVYQYLHISNFVLIHSKNKKMISLINIFFSNVNQSFRFYISMSSYKKIVS